MSRPSSSSGIPPPPESLARLVAANARWFEGVHAEDTFTLADAEARLGAQLPSALKWLLAVHGYSSACGVSSLDDAVAMTLRARGSIRLPPRFAILEDRGDAGVVLLDLISDDGSVAWVGSHQLEAFTAGRLADDMDIFADFTTWIERCLHDAKDEVEW